MPDHLLTDDEYKAVEKGLSRLRQSELYARAIINLADDEGLSDRDKVLRMRAKAEWWLATADRPLETGL